MQVVAPNVGVPCQRHCRVEQNTQNLIRLEVVVLVYETFVLQIFQVLNGYHLDFGMTNNVTLTTIMRKKVTLENKEVQTSKFQDREVGSPKNCLVILGISQTTSSSHKAALKTNSFFKVTNYQIPT